MKHDARVREMYLVVMKKFLQVDEIKKFHRKKCIINNFIAV